METQIKTEPVEKVKNAGIQRIVPFLWFDNQAEEAIGFYTSLFKNSKVKAVTRYNEAGSHASGMPKDSVMTVNFLIGGKEFVALNGGPVFKINPAITFMINCDSHDEINELWKKLSAGGTVMMELDTYPFSQKFGWLSDKYGVSWQLNMGNHSQKITPLLWFNGKAKEAIHFYTSLFEDSDISYIEYFGAGESGPQGAVKHATFSLDGEAFMAMDNNDKFPFTTAISFVMNCRTQEELDYFWEKLSEGGDERAQQCGWLQDKYGVSWQIVPAMLGEILSGNDLVRSGRVMQAILQMKKIDIKTLQKAYEL